MCYIKKRLISIHALVRSSLSSSCSSLTWTSFDLSLPKITNVICMWFDKYLLNSQSRSNITTDGRSVSQYVKVSSPFWDLWPDITFCPKVVVWKLLFFFNFNFNQQSEFTFYKLMLWLLQCHDEKSCLCRASSLTRGRFCHSQSIVMYQYLHKAFTLHLFYSWAIYIQYTIYQASLSPVSV
jgi:hypothetical protein